MPTKALMQTKLVQEHKEKTIHTKGTQGFNVVQPTMPTSTDEKEYFHYVIKYVTKKRTKYN